MTEAIGIAMTPPNGPNKPGSTGPPGAGVALSVRDEHGAEMAPGDVGQLWIRYNGVMVGYWDHPEATAEVFAGEWFDTGDLVRVDTDGYVWFSGRRKQIIIHDGSNIAPQEVEDALSSTQPSREPGSSACTICNTARTCGRTWRWFQKLSHQARAS